MNIFYFFLMIHKINTQRYEKSIVRMIIKNLLTVLIDCRCEFIVIVSLLLLFIHTHLLTNRRQVRQVIFLRQIDGQIVCILSYIESIGIWMLQRYVITSFLQFQYILLNHLAIDIETIVQQILPLIINHTALLPDYRMHGCVSIQ